MINKLFLIITFSFYSVLLLLISYLVISISKNNIMTKILMQFQRLQVTV